MATYSLPERNAETGALRHGRRAQCACTSPVGHMGRRPWSTKGSSTGQKTRVLAWGVSGACVFARVRARACARIRMCVCLVLPVQGPLARREVLGGLGASPVQQAWAEGKAGISGLRRRCHGPPRAQHGARGGKQGWGGGLRGCSLSCGRVAALL